MTIMDVRGVLQALPQIASEVRAAGQAIQAIIDELPVELLSMFVPDFGADEVPPIPVEPSPVIPATPTATPTPTTTPDTQAESRIIPLDFGGKYPKPETPKPEKIFRSKEALAKEAAQKAEAEAKAGERVLVLLSDQPMHINELCRACQIPVSGLLALLLQLEFAGQIKRLPGERFQKNRLTK
jgi:hypothetical protein